MTDNAASNAAAFDVLPPLNSQGSAAVAEHLREWFDGYDGDLGHDVHQLHVTAENDLGFCSILYNVGGTLKTADVIDMWVRATLCCRRIDGTWRIVRAARSACGLVRPTRSRSPARAEMVT